MTKVRDFADVASGLTATATELNILDGATVTTGEVNYNDITTLGTSEASKAVTADGSGDVQIANGELRVLGTGGSSTNSLDLDYNATSGVATIQADSNGGSTSLNF